jgi:hypothetical protein
MRHDLPDIALGLYLPSIAREIARKLSPFSHSVASHSSYVDDHFIL